MPLQSFLVSPFDTWAVPKLRVLADARATDAVLGAETGPDSNFCQLLRQCMAEYDSQPFSRPDLPGSTPDSVIITTDILRQSAESFFWYHTHPGRLTLLNAYEAKSGACDGTLLHAVTALELWASAHVARIRELTWLELGIPAVDDASQLPQSFGEQRNIVVRREFDLLSVAEQMDWNELAHEITVVMARVEIAVSAIQSRQESISQWMHDTIEEKMATSAMGESMVIHWQGFHVGKEDKRLNEFQGHTSTAGDPCWFDSPTYSEYVDDLWHNFVDDEVDDLVICSLKPLPHDLCAALPDYQYRLKSFLAELFRLQCGLEELNEPVFWARVKAHPDQFVAPHRLPDGIVFADPFHMKPTDFRVLYTHVWSCHEHTSALDARFRFIFEPKMIGEYIALNEAEQLKATWDRKTSYAAIPTHGSATDGPTIGMVEAELWMPTTADSTASIDTRASPATVPAVDSAHVPDLRSPAGPPLEVSPVLSVAPTAYKRTAKQSGDDQEGQLAKAARLSLDEDSTTRRVSGDSGV